MSLMFVAIEKEASFQGRTERWSNVYCYESSASTESAYQALITGVLNAERPVHANTVSFKLARIYTTEGLNGLTDPGSMLAAAELSVVGTGVNSGTGQCYRECAVLVKWPLPRKQFTFSVGRQRSLKKWIHMCGTLALSSANMEGTSQIVGTALTPFATYASAVRVPASGSLLSSPDGTPSTDNAIVHPWVEHRQFPRGRKET